MTQTELIQSLFDNLSIPKSTLRHLLRTLRAVIHSNLMADQPSSLPRLGTIIKIARAARNRWNPRTSTVQSNPPNNVVKMTRHGLPSQILEPSWSPNYDYANWHQYPDSALAAQLATASITDLKTCNLFVSTLVSTIIDALYDADTITINNLGTWTARDYTVRGFQPASPIAHWQAVCWAPELGIFCAVNNTPIDYAVMHSKLADHWQPEAAILSVGWLGICWAPELGIFCAVGQAETGGNSMTSPDGQNWTASAQITSAGGTDVCWAPELGIFCAVGFSINDINSAVAIMTSPDGQAWSPQTAPQGGIWQAVSWAPALGIFCVVGLGETSSDIMISPDGQNWTPSNEPRGGSYHDVCWAPELGIFCAVAGNGLSSVTKTSTDGLGWD